MKKGRSKAETNDALQSLLGELDGGQKTGGKKRKRIIAAVAVVLAAAVGSGSFFFVRAKQNSSEEPVYREYTVQRGDIMVGLTESSVITLNKETVTFPVGAEVLEVYVKSGAQVKEGDPLVQMSTDDISDALSDYEQQIAAAKADVESAKLSRDTELLKAKQTMENSLLSSSQSDAKYSQTVAQLQLDLKTAQQSADDAQKKYDDLYAQSKTFPSDLAKLTQYETKVDTCQQKVDQWTQKETAYSKVSDQLSKTESKIKAIADASNMEQARAILSELQQSYTDMAAKYAAGSTTTVTTTAASSSVSAAASETPSASDTLPASASETPSASASVSASASASSTSGQQTQSQSVKYSELLKAKEKAETLAGKMSELETLFSEKSKLEKELASYDADAISDNLTAAKEALSDAQTAYNDCKADFTETYGTITTQYAMDTALRDAETAVEKAQLNLQSQNSAYSSSVLTAQQTKSDLQQTGSGAQKTYALKKTELDQKVDEAQKQYEELVEQMQDVKDAVGNDGVVTAPCGGIISALNVEAGDTLTVGGESSGFGGTSSSSGASLLTITDMTEINVSVSISEDEILDVSLDQEASVSIAAFPDETFDGVVDSISVEGATIGAATVNYTVNVKCTQTDHELYDGMSADVTLIQGSAKDVLYVSKQAVTTRDGKAYVLRKGEDGTGVETQVSTGFSDGQYTQIVSGLQQGDVVLTESALGAAGSPSAGASADRASAPDMGSFSGSGSFDFPAQGSFPGGKSGGSR